MLESALFLIVSYLAAVVATIAGFGSSTLLIPVAIQFMDIKTAVFIVACFHFFNNVFKIRAFWGKADFRIFLLFGIPSIVFAFTGARLITVMPIDVIRVILAVFLIVFSIYSLVKPKFSLKKTETNAVLGGSFSGFLAGLIGMGGAIRSTFLVSFNLPKEIYVATSAMIAAVIDLTRIPTYLFTNVVQSNSYWILLLLLIPCAYAGVKTGKVLLNKVNQQTFQRVVTAAILLAGIKLLI